LAEGHKHESSDPGAECASCSERSPYHDRYSCSVSPSTPSTPPTTSRPAVPPSTTGSPLPSNLLQPTMLLSVLINQTLTSTPLLYHRPINLPSTRAAWPAPDLSTVVGLLRFRLGDDVSHKTQGSLGGPASGTLIARRDVQ
jgi:hypothetical protein